MTPNSVNFFINILPTFFMIFDVKRTFLIWKKK